MLLACLKRAIAMAVAALLSVPWSSDAASPSAPSTEFQLKAAFVLNFARFVEWPSSTFANATTPIVIGVLGEDPIEEALRTTVAGKVVDGRPVTVRTLARARDAEGCHLLFIAQSERNGLTDTIGQLQNKPVLTISDLPDFTERGGMIELKRRQDLVRFDINLPAAEASGLKISSKLLKLADNFRR